jgi:thiol-disulfide isomerase/thioredoxin
MKIKIFMIAFVIVVFLSNAAAQISNASEETRGENDTNPIKDLRKAEPGDLESDKPMMLDASVIPMYDDKLVLIKENEFRNMMMSGNYMAEPFIDSNKVVKAIVLRHATDIEMQQIKKMKGSMPNPIENKAKVIGKQAPAFSVIDLLGNEYSLNKLKGKVIVINFWFVECKPCVMEIPELNNLVEKYAEKEVVFLAFTLNDKSKINSFLNKNTFKYNIIPDSKASADLYNVNSYPTHLIIDENSIISYSSSGYGPTSIDELTKAIESLTK